MATSAAGHHGTATPSARHGQHWPISVSRWCASCFRTCRATPRHPRRPNDRRAASGARRRARRTAPHARCRAPAGSPARTATAPRDTSRRPPSSSTAARTGRVCPSPASPPRRRGGALRPGCRPPHSATTGRSYRQATAGSPPATPCPSPDGWSKAADDPAATWRGSARRGSS